MVVLALVVEALPVTIVSVGVGAAKSFAAKTGAKGETANKKINRITVDFWIKLFSFFEIILSFWLIVIKVVFL